MTSTRYLLNPDRAVGMFLGAAAGDALGWPQEDRSQIVGGNAARQVEPRASYRSWARNGGTQFSRYLDPVDAGQYSDDTQLMLSVARSSFAGPDWYEWFTRIELPQWPLYQRGGGGAVLRASRAWGEARPPWRIARASDEGKVASYFNAGANGVAMRIAPHVLAVYDANTDVLLSRVVKDGMATHGHPRALLGAAVHALTLRYALRQSSTLEYGELLHAIIEERSWRNPGILIDSLEHDWHDASQQLDTELSRRGPGYLWEATADEMDSLLQIAADGLSRGPMANDQQTLTELGCFDKRQSGSGTVAAVAAMYIAARTASRPMSGLLRAGFLKGADTDTLCSMTGSILGALHGSSWLGELGTNVQDRGHIVGTALRMADIANGGYPTNGYSPVPPTHISSAALRNWTTKLFADGDVETLPDGRQVHIREIVELQARSGSFVTRATLATGDEQTLLVDRVAKRPIEGGGASRLGKPNSTEASEDLPEAQERTDASPRDASAAVLRTELAVPDLAEAASFFTEVVGVQLTFASRRVGISEGIWLCEASPSRVPGPHSGVFLTIVVASLIEVEARATRHGNTQFAWSTDKHSLWLVGPGDMRIRLLETSVVSAGRTASTEPNSLADKRESISGSSFTRYPTLFERDG
ncbi:ADP-ribosylglycohydrolase family protein [Pseudarthrobacter sp. 1G09]|uniref:ADP-ribosylglycohydrolase family protein n=1 Tax=Pseudarthrobacter sp. 1G09 TaxID=3416178 RepID=UPI003CF5BA7E